MGKAQCPQQISSDAQDSCFQPQLLNVDGFLDLNVSQPGELKHMILLDSGQPIQASRDPSQRLTLTSGS